MKKMIYVGLMVMVSVMVFGTGAAEEQAVSDNMIAGVSQERLATEQTSEGAEGILIARLDMEIYEYAPSLCNQLEKTCRDASPTDTTGICDYFTAENCPKNFKE